jgi:hypothetical protein
MRCDDVTRELAIPTGALDPADLAAHLASCASCAEWSSRSSRLDRIWEATRPAEPSADALDSLWAHASAALDAPATLRLEAPIRPRRWATVAFALASAAAVLLAASALLRDPAADPHKVVDNRIVPPTVQVTNPVPAPPVVKVSVDVDQIAIVRIGEEGHRVEILDEAPLFASSSLADDTPHDRFNAWESMASR